VTVDVHRPELDALDRDRAVDLYRTMVRIRAFEDATNRLFRAGEVPGFVHLSIGQEAVAAGVCAALQRRDTITSTHRGHGHTLAKGADTRHMMAELFGKEEGCCRGRGGSMHIADFSVGMLGANAIVAGGLGIATGAALSTALLGDDRVALSFFGDGATARGPFHEALNLAKVWQLPVIFVCESNGWASTTASSEALAVPQVADRAAAYDMPAEVVDGNDVYAVHAAARRAVGRARGGGGPTLLDMHTYRMEGHFVGDPMKYRDPEEVATWGARDPIVRAAAALEAAGHLDRAGAEQIQAEATEEIERAVAFARAGTDPDPADLHAHLYAS
jgi:TPP-dependent pyruvate/acetoin dehydrogenase alpha subunit